VYYETRARSLLKTISWRTWATITTALLVLAFTGRFELAIAIGSLEVVAKLILYFFHERAWAKLKWGKREMPAFVLWFTGLPASGKTTVADMVHEELLKRGLKAERLDSHDLRGLFPETGFTPDEVDNHVRRVGHLASMLEKQGVVVVASFVSPYRESRDFARRLCANFIEVHMDSTPEACAARDERGLYEQARRGQIADFPGVSAPYEPPLHPEIHVAVDSLAAEEVARLVLQALKPGRNGARAKAPHLARVQHQQS